MGEYSIKGPRVSRELPCHECVKACCRKADGVEVFHSNVVAIVIDDIGIEYDDHGNCPHLNDEGLCSLQLRNCKPVNCRLYDCSADTLFRSLHPHIDALLKSHDL